MYIATHTRVTRDIHTLPQFVDMTAKCDVTGLIVL